MDYLVRFVQVHESFRKPEIEALAVLANVDVGLLAYSERVGLSSVNEASDSSSIPSGPQCPQ